MSNGLALLSALLWGFAAFFGGQAARRTHLFSLLALDQTLAALIALPCAIVLAEEFLFRDLLIGGLSGLFGTAGVAFFYLGLRKDMVVIAPITGVVSALLPLLWGLGIGEQLSLVQLFGAVLGLCAILLVSGSNWGEVGFRVDSIVNGVLAGTGFGFSYIVLNSTSPSTAPWPIFSSRLVPAILILLAATRAPWPARASKESRGFIAGASLSDVLAAVFYLAALKQGLLSTSSVLSCLHPAVTVVLARVFLKEHISVSRGFGLLAAITSISMITVG